RHRPVRTPHPGSTVAPAPVVIQTAARGAKMTGGRRVLGVKGGNDMAKRADGNEGDIRHDCPHDCRHAWTTAEVAALFDLPLSDLVPRAQTLHRRYFDPHAVQISTLLSIKTGSCPEDCAYCPQSAHYRTDTERSALMDTRDVVAAA